MTLRTELKLAYRRSGLTLGQVAGRAGCHVNTVWAVLSGRNVRTESLFRVCRALGVGEVPVPDNDDLQRRVDASARQ